jgi:hypothetical protein
MSASLRLRSAALLLAAVPVLAACGDDTAGAGADPTATPTKTTATAKPTKPTKPTKPAPTRATKSSTPQAMPQCAAAWRVGAALPDPYRGCQGPAGAVEATAQRCEFGQRLYTYAGRFYAVAGGPVNRTAQPLASDARYQAALKACTA